ncbi:MAG TPA: DUF4097 family beta strand repeat-containing protein [Thermoanaerobaculia bacterium]
MRRCWRASAALLAVLAPLAAGAQTEVERRVPARAEGTVEIVNVAGSLVVSGWDREEVEVTGTLGRGIDALVVRAVRGEVKVEAEPGRSGHQGSAHLEVRVPHRSRVAVETVSAEVLVAGLEGELDVESISGPVEVEGDPSAVAVETVSGDVTVRRARGRVAVETVNGRITIEGGRDLRAQSVSGAIVVDGAGEVERAELGVVSGRILFAAALARGAEARLSSHSGAVEVALPGASAARFDVSSFSGRITNELGPPAEKAGRFTPEHKLVFGSGDARVHVETFSGSVTLRKR